MKNNKTIRYDSIDALRGVSMIWMTLFHLSFDLNYFGYLKGDFYRDSFWTTQRVCIVSLFLFCAGLSQAVSVVQGQTWARFWNRWFYIAGTAVLVSIGSYLMYPATFIYFGILHGIALMLIVVRWSAGWGKWLWAVGLGIVSIPLLLPYVHATWPILDFLNTPAFNWLGLISRKPITEDYAPLVPWLGVMLFGMAAGTWVLRSRSWLEVKCPALLQPLVFLGRRSLGYCLLHQPIMIGSLMLFGSFIPLINY